MVAHKSFENQTQSSPTVRMRKGRCKLQWIATNIFILFGLIFIIIELELIKKEISTIKIQTQKGTGFKSVGHRSRVNLAENDRWLFSSRPYLSGLQVKFNNCTCHICNFYLDHVISAILATIQAFCHGSTPYGAFTYACVFENI